MVASIHVRITSNKETTVAEKKASKQSRGIEENQLPTEDEIRTRAYEIYCARNSGPGSEVDDWLKAEIEIKGAMAG